MANLWPDFLIALIYFRSILGYQKDFCITRVGSEELFLDSSICCLTNTIADPE